MSKRHPNPEQFTKEHCQSPSIFMQHIFRTKKISARKIIPNENLFHKSKFVFWPEKYVFLCKNYFGQNLIFLRENLLFLSTYILARKFFFGSKLIFKTTFFHVSFQEANFKNQKTVFQYNFWNPRFQVRIPFYATFLDLNLKLKDLSS